MTMNADLHLFEDRGEGTDGVTFKNVKPRVRCTFSHEGKEHRFYIDGVQAMMIRNIFTRSARAYLANEPAPQEVTISEIVYGGDALP